MARKRKKRIIVAALRHAAKWCEAWGKALEAKSAECQDRIDRWSRRMDEKIDSWGKP